MSTRNERQKNAKEENAKTYFEYKELLKAQEKSNAHTSFFNEEDTQSAWQSENKAAVSLSTLKGLFHDDEWVYILTNVIASKIAAQPLKVTQKTGTKKGKQTFEFDEDHPVNELLRFPTDTQTYYEWMYSIVADHTVAGNAIVWYVKRKAQIPHIPVEMIDIDVFTESGKIRSYDIMRYESDMMGGVIPHRVHSIDPKAVAHMKRPNPSSPIYGMSPLFPGRRVILFSRYSLEYLNNFYIRGAQPGLVLDMNDVSNEKNALRLLRSMEQAHSGRRNQRRNMVLPKGVKANNMTHTLADQQLKDFLPLNREAIINLLSVPKHELSIAESGSLGSEEYKVALRNFWAGPLTAIMGSVEQGLSRVLRAELGEDRFLKFDLSEVEILRDDMIKKGEVAEKMLLTHTVNQVREIVYSDEPVEGGDTLQSQAPAASLFQQPQTSAPSQQPAETSEADDLDDQLDENEDEETKDLSPEERNNKVLANNRESFQRLKSQNPEWWDKREDRLAREAVKGVVDLGATFESMHKSQLTEAIKEVKKELKKQGRKSLNTKASDIRKSTLRRKINRAISKENFEEQWVDDTVKTLSSTVDVGYDTQFELPFNIPNRDEIEALKRSNAGQRRDILEARGLKTFSRINETTTERIIDRVEKGVSESKTIDEIAKDIEEHESEISASRSQVIARTETLTAASLGQAAAMQDAAKTIPGLKKMWVTAGDNRVRGNPNAPKSKFSHFKVDGEVKDWNKKFSNGLEFPRDPTGEAGDVIQCRCSWIMIPPEMAEEIGVSDFQAEIAASNE